MRVDITKPYEISPEALRRLLSFDAITGIMIWKERDLEFFQHITDPRGPEWCCNVWNSKFANKVAFSLTTHAGYKYGMVLGVYMMAHKAMWILHHGEMPIMHIDHINRDKSDNRIENLRLATRQQNTANSMQMVSKSSRYKGVSWCKRSKKWGTGITIDGKRKFLGYHADEADAARAYDAASIAAHGKYALLNFEVCDG